MNLTKEFRITDYSVNPGPRYKHQGKHSGEGLRPALAKLLRDHRGRIRVILDGTKGIGSSFLDEAFGGLVRDENFSRRELEKRFDFVSTVDPSYVNTILDSLRRAERDSHTA